MTDQLDEWREFYQTGDKEALTSCLNHCMTFNSLIPEWAAKAFCEAHHKIRTYQVKSWDEVLGRPLKKGKRLATERRNVEIWDLLFREIVKRHRAGAAINKELFSEVGAKFGVSGTVASDIYYEIPDDIREIEETIMDQEETSGKT
jgi:hypothetical protein